MTWLTEAPSLYSAMRSEAYQASYIGRESPDWGRQRRARG